MNGYSRKISAAVLPIVILLAVSILLPMILVKIFYDKAPEQAAPIPIIPLDTDNSHINVSIYISKKKTVETVPLESYVRGVLAAEMPAEFEMEALKAQAVAARTYIIRRIIEKDYSQVPAEGAMVTDTVTHQAYLSEEDIGRNWDPEDYSANLSKLNRAVNETKGIIMTYENKPIQAAFFSTSNGYTENSEEYWQDYMPYLRSVPSPWDAEISPKYKTTSTYELKTFYNKLGINSIPASSNGSTIQVLEKSNGNRIKQIQIGGKMFTGREVREKLGLNSSHFTWEFNNGQIVLTTYGYGHGIGMSQYGANGLAKEGKRADEILKYYYKGIQLKKLTKKTAS
jgi:stage II sporulation protein D